MKQYQSPVINVVRFCQKGIICVSGENFSVSDPGIEIGGNDVWGDDLDW